MMRRFAAPSVLLLLLILVYFVSSPTVAADRSPEAGTSRVYLANHTQGSLTVTAACDSSSIAAVPGEVTMIECADPSAVTIGVSGEGAAVLTAAQDDSFLLPVACPDGERTLQGAVEIVEGMLPQRRDTFIHLWAIGECAQ